MASLTTLPCSTLMAFLMVRLWAQLDRPLKAEGKCTINAAERDLEALSQK